MDSSKEKGKQRRENLFERVSVHWHSGAVEYHSCVSTPHRFTGEHFLYAFRRPVSLLVKAAISQWVCSQKSPKYACVCMYSRTVGVCSPLRGEMAVTPKRLEEK